MKNSHLMDLSDDKKNLIEITIETDFQKSKRDTNL